MRNSFLKMEFDLLHDDGSHQSFNKVEENFSNCRIYYKLHSQSVIKATLTILMFENFIFMIS
jgi:hypothetical protein